MRLEVKVNFNLTLSLKLCEHWIVITVPRDMAPGSLEASYTISVERPGTPLELSIVNLGVQGFQLFRVL